MNDDEFLLLSGGKKRIINAVRSATNPATYFDTSGIMQLETRSNVPRYNKGYYDATGWHTSASMLVEGASTNYAKNSYFANAPVDGFEDGTSAGWEIETHQNSTAAIDASAKKDGSYGAKIDIVETGSDGYTEAMFERSLLTPIDHVTLECDMYIADATSIGEDIRVLNAQSTVDYGGIGCIKLRTDGSQLKIGGSYTNSAGTVVARQDETVVTTGVWYHLKYTVNQTDGTFRWWLDGALKTNYSGGITTENLIDRIYFGGGIANKPDNFTLYFDNVTMPYLTKIVNSVVNNLALPGWTMEQSFTGTLALTFPSIESSLVNIPDAKSFRTQYTWNHNENQWAAMFSSGKTPNDSFDNSEGGVRATISFLIKGDVSGMPTNIRLIEIGEYDNADAYKTNGSQMMSSITLSTTLWKKYSYTYTLQNTASRKLRLNLFGSVGGPANGETMDIQIACLQIENSATGTTYIPTATAVLTRNIETLA